MSEGARRELHAMVDAMAGRELRVLGVAAVVAGSVSIPSIADQVRFDPLHGDNLGLLAAGAALLLLALESMKLALAPHGAARAKGFQIPN